MAQGLWNIRRHLVEIKVGVFFIAAVALVFFGLISLREMKFFKGTYNINVEFQFAEGLTPAAPVRFCGVDVGEVKGVSVVERGGHPIVQVKVTVQQGTRIPGNANFFINSLSLFGEKYMEITPAPDKQEGYLKEGDTVVGLSPIPLFNVFVTFDKTMKEVTDFVKEGKIKTSFENTLLNLETMTADIREIVKSVKGGNGTIGRFLYDDSLYKETEEFISDLKSHPWKLLHMPKGQPAPKPGSKAEVPLKAEVSDKVEAGAAAKGN